MHYYGMTRASQPFGNAFADAGAAARYQRASLY
jgi:hypothetical protein